MARFTTYNVGGHRHTTLAAKRPPDVVCPCGPTSCMQPRWPAPTSQARPHATCAKNGGTSKAAWPHFAASPAACQPPTCGGAPTRRTSARVHASEGPARHALMRRQPTPDKRSARWPSKRHASDANAIQRNVYRNPRVLIWRLRINLVIQTSPSLCRVWRFSPATANSYRYKKNAKPRTAVECQIFCALIWLVRDISAHAAA